MIRTDEHDTKLISLMGVEDCDIAYYMARALNAVGHRVLVVDNTGSAELFESIRKPDDEEMAQTGELYYIRHKAYSENFFALYDYVLICHGYRINAELNEKSDIRFITTDYRPQITGRICKELQRQDDNLAYYVICRNKVFSKISERIILEELQLLEKDVKETYQLSYSDQDYACYIGLLRNGAASIRSTSAEMKDLLNSFLGIVMEDASDKEKKTAYKKILSGKIR